jgi:hypothetical protein
VRSEEFKPGAGFRWRSRDWMVLARVGDDVLAWDGEGPTLWHGAEELARAAEQSISGLDATGVTARCRRHALMKMIREVPAYVIYDERQELHPPSRSMIEQLGIALPASHAWNPRDKSRVERQMMRIQRQFEALIAVARRRPRRRR